MPAPAVGGVARRLVRPRKGEKRTRGHAGRRLVSQLVDGAFSEIGRQRTGSLLRNALVYRGEVRRALGSAVFVGCRLYELYDVAELTGGGVLGKLGRNADTYSMCPSLVHPN